RMKELIDALFVYSTLGKERIAHVKTDLCDVVEEVKKNYYDVIEDKKAKIYTEYLPSLYVDPIQLYQLFSNLIDNSIKYGKKDVPPVIEISAELLKNYALKKDRGPQDYWKITFADNGIGFDTEFNDKIFELFNRLHGKAEYPGT